MTAASRTCAPRSMAPGYDLAPIMSYSTKFASNFYGPFRDAADSAPQFGDRSSYQLDVRNRSDALASSRRCAEEGADLLMVKPGQPSADLIRPIHEQTGLPVGAYQVSGEYTSLVLVSAREVRRLRRRAARELVQPAARRRQLHHHLRRASRAGPGAAALMRYFPLFLDIKDKPVLLVGGGEVAARKFSLLVDAGAQDHRRRARCWAKSSPRRWRAALFTHHAREFAAGDIDGAWLVVAATDDRAVNAAVVCRRKCRAHSLQRRRRSRAVQFHHARHHRSLARADRRFPPAAPRPCSRALIRERLETLLDSSLRPARRVRRSLARGREGASSRTSARAAGFCRGCSPARGRRRAR